MTRNIGIYLLMLLLLLTTSCDFNDDRDSYCCDECSEVDFRYLLKNTDRFDTYIESMRYYLFDASDGHYVGELYGNDDDLSVVSLDGLWAGDFSLVGIGNLDDYGALTGLSDGLDNLCLVVSDSYEGSDDTDLFANGDRLYWGQCDFTLPDVESVYTFQGDMANVHCCLTVRVEWEGLPEYSSGYSLELDGIGSWTELCQTNATTLNGQLFPPVGDYSARMREDVPLRKFALQASLYTLRYTNTDLPVLRVLHDEDSVITDIDLTEVFSQLQWYPDQAWVQGYELLVTICSDGQVVLTEGLTGDVSDWETGGSLG